MPRAKAPRGYKVLASGRIRRGDLLHFLRVPNIPEWEKADGLVGATAEHLADVVIVARPAVGRRKVSK